MRLLYDSVLPRSLSLESPAGVVLERWDGSDVSDSELVGQSAEQGYRGVIFWGRESLQQFELKESAQEAGVALIAVEADDPKAAKQRILKNLPALRRELGSSDCVLVLANEVRSV